MWEYQNKDDSTWNKVGHPDVKVVKSAAPWNCSAMTETRLLTLILTSHDRDRTYRCYLRKNGNDLNDNLGKNSQFTVKINSPLRAGLYGVPFNSHLSIYLFIL